MLGGRALAGMKFRVRSNFLRDSHLCRFSIHVMLLIARLRYSSSCDDNKGGRGVEKRREGEGD